ncbi:MAG: hypothetical protein GX303_08535 [Clostridiales bacterium]|nr:hypothetical protein [Clostridiales bacterium]
MHKKNGRIVAIFLSLIMICSIVVTTAFAKNVTPQVNGSNVDIEESLDPIEVVSLREENTKHFRLQDGTYQAVVYSEPVHRKDTKGEWRDIDNRLAVTNTNTYSTSDNRINFAQSPTSDGKIFSLKENAYSITLGLSSKQLFTKSNAKVNNHPDSTLISKNFTNLEDLKKINNKTSVIYKNIFENTDLEYVIVANNIKENIIVKEVCESYKYVFELEAVGLTAILEDDGSITLRDAKSGETKYIMPAPFMYDADGNRSYDVNYILSEISHEKYELIVTADDKWLNDESRVFPVVIDPTFTSWIFSDSYIDERNPNFSYGYSEELWVGTNYSHYISYIEPGLLTLPNYATITNAKLHIAYYYGVTSGYINVGAYDVLYDLTGFNYNNLTYRQIVK